MSIRVIVIFCGSTLVYTLFRQVVATAGSVALNTSLLQPWHHVSPKRSFCDFNALVFQLFDYFFAIDACISRQHANDSPGRLLCRRSAIDHHVAFSIKCVCLIRRQLPKPSSYEARPGFLFIGIEVMENGFHNGTMTALVPSSQSLCHLIQPAGITPDQGSIFQSEAGQLPVKKGKVIWKQGEENCIRNRQAMSVKGRLVGWRKSRMPMFSKPRSVRFVIPA